MPRWNAWREVLYETACRRFLDCVRGPGCRNGRIGVRTFEQCASRMARRCSARRRQTESGSVRSEWTRDLLSRSGRFAELFAYPEKNFGGQGLSRGPRQRGREFRGELAGTNDSEERGSRQNSLLPQPHGPSGHVADSEEGFDGDGLHSRL